MRLFQSAPGYIQVRGPIAPRGHRGAGQFGGMDLEPRQDQLRGKVLECKGFYALEIKENRVLNSDPTGWREIKPIPDGLYAACHYGDVRKVVGVRGGKLTEDLTGLVPFFPPQWEGSHKSPEGYQESIETGTKAINDFCLK